MVQIGFVSPGGVAHDQARSVRLHAIGEFDHRHQLVAAVVAGQAEGQGVAAEGNLLRQGPDPARTRRDPFGHPALVVARIGHLDQAGVADEGLVYPGRSCDDGGRGARLGERLGACARFDPR
jgi:hypothetical protein